MAQPTATFDFDFAPLAPDLAKAKRAAKVPFVADPAILAKIKTACVTNGGVMSTRPYPTITEARKAGLLALPYVDLVATELGKAVPKVAVIDSANNPAAIVKTKEGENVTRVDSGPAPYRYVIRLANTRNRKETATATPAA
jgi:hypothetical protein